VVKKLAIPSRYQVIRIVELSQRVPTHQKKPVTNGIRRAVLVKNGKKQAVLVASFRQSCKNCEKTAGLCLEFIESGGWPENGFLNRRRAD
jgi:hypothetical protein